MKLTIDGQQRDWTYNDETPLQDVMLDVNRRLLLDEKRVVSEIKVDETEPGLDMSLTPDQVPIGKILAISFMTTPFNNAFIDNLEAADNKLEHVKASISEIVDHIISDRIDKGMNMLRDGIDILIWFFDAVQQANMCGVVNLESIAVGQEEKLLDFIARLNGILNELVTAMKNNDFTLINDYLEYELEPAVDALKNTIPQLISLAKGN